MRQDEWPAPAGVKESAYSQVIVASRQESDGSPTRSDRRARRRRKPRPARSPSRDWPLGYALAAIAVGVLFGIVHASTYPVNTLPVKAVFGVITCLLYERTRSLYPCIVLHCLVDGSGFEASVQRGEAWIAYLACLLVGIFVLIHHRFRAPTAQEVDAYRWRPGRAAGTWARSARTTSAQSEKT